ncbi:MAG: hypothetical protein A2020_02675 [Lentisphaerae bacterium GWF2_45_14]|nr:MAG: hypothetical protein A2020_02675 [Lentisphaerae bacterium GWF2_45_14]
MINNQNVNVYPEIERSGFPFRLISATYGIAGPKTPIIQRTNYECCTVEFIFEGRGFLEINGFSFAPGPDSIYILHKNSNHRYWPDFADPWKKIFFVIDGEFMEEIFRAYRFENVYHLPGCGQLRGYFDEMMQLGNDTDSIHSHASIIFHKILGEANGILHGAEQALPDDVARLKKMLDSGTEEKVNLGDLCLKLHRSSAHMVRCFKSYLGITPYDYLMQKKVEAARLLLHHSYLSIKEIAARLKFSDQYYFSNYFKRKTGVSPQKYRLKTRQ